jgi:hypothetical protein
MSTQQPTTSDPAQPDGGVPGERDERRWGGLVVISAAVLVFVAVALAVVAFLVHGNASDTQANADRIERVARQQTAARVSASRDLVALHAAADHSYATLGTLMAAYQAQLASQNHAIDVANQAAASYNSGQVNVADALKAEAQPAVADAEAKTAAVHGALGEVKQAFETLQRAAG